MRNVEKRLLSSTTDKEGGVADSKDRNPMAGGAHFAAMTKNALTIAKKRAKLAEMFSCVPFFSYLCTVINNS